MAINDVRRSRRAAIIAAGSSTALILAACGNDADPTTSDDLPSGGPIEITWHGSDARNAAIQEVIDWFADENPDLGITSQPTTWDSYWDRVSVQASANNIACVVTMHSRYQTRYEERDNLLALDGLIDDGTIDVSGIPDDVLESQRGADGNLYTIPYGIWFEGTTRNVPLIEDLGLTAPDPQDGWQEYIDWAVSAVDEVPDDVYILADRGHEITQFQAFLLERGEDLYGDEEVGFSQESLVEWWELWLEAIDEGAAPPREVTSEYNGVPTQQNLMAEGRQLVATGPDTVLADVQAGLDHNEAGQVSMVRSPTGDAAQVLGTNSWAISSNCENVVDSAEFINHFVNSTDGALTLSGQTGLPPVTESLEALADDPDVPDFLRASIDLYGDLLEDGATVDTWPDGTQDLVGQFTQSYEPVAFGQTTAEEASEQFISTANAALSGF